MDSSEFYKLYGNSIASDLRNASSIYLKNAINLYLEIEGKVTLYDDMNLATSANIICSLNRCIEHLLKLHIALTDPILLFPLPKKPEDYLKFKELNINLDKKKLHIILPKTITFQNAINISKLLIKHDDFDFSIFVEIHTLRNIIEHFWDRNDKFIQKNIGIMSSKILPSIELFVTNILNDSFDKFINEAQKEEVKRLDRALLEGHTLKAQRRLEEHKELYNTNKEMLEKIEHYPNKYINYEEDETDSKCPVCDSFFYAKWDIEADYDGYEQVGAYPDVKCMYCKNCHFYVESNDLYKYLPERFEEKLLDDMMENYDNYFDYP